MVRGATVSDWRELSLEEVKRLLRKSSKVKVYEVIYKGLPVSKTAPVRRFTMRHIQEKVVNEEDANVLLRNGWEIVDIYDPDDDD